jgi:hypothetical protein
MSQPERKSRFEEVALRLSSWVSAAKNFGAVAAIVAFALGAVAWYNANTDGPLWIRFVLVAVGSVAIAAPCGAFLHRFLFRRKEVPQGYKWGKAVYVYSVDRDDKRQQRQDVSISIIARRDNLSMFESRFRWTGRGESKITLESDDQELLGPLASYDGWQYYYVHLNHPLLFGEEAKIDFVQEFYDEEEAFRPVLSKHVREDMDSLTLRVVFNGDMPAEGKVEALERSAHRNDQIMRRHKLEYDKVTKSVTFTVNSPKKGRIYAIEWTWRYP